MFYGLSQMSIQKNLQFLLDQRHLNANSLSELTDGELSQPTTRRILQGTSKNIRDETLEKYATFFKVPLGTLKFGDVSKGIDVAQDPNGPNLLNMDVWDDSTPLHEDDVELPYFKEVLFAAGSGATQVIEETEKKLRFSKRTLKNAGVDPSNAACATNHGTSMENTILDKAAIGIDKSKQQIKDGKIYAFDHGGLLRVKRLYRQPFGAVKIVSDNKEYEDEFLTAEQWQSDVRLLGWVFWWSTVDKW
ncbi:TPA: helix-turn-helix transcriptional regulator [Acinetobacter nosocomialis]|nr:helix-turn-helix transcriptional regulator [Acinetobacter nosocomialis]HAV5443949.1 helix-turn-helix transcriptional regulator [Acinetobacter baumannii]